jgi:hypothetical protein
MPLWWNSYLYYSYTGLTRENGCEPHIVKKKTFTKLLQFGAALRGNSPTPTLTMKEAEFFYESPGNAGATVWQTTLSAMTAAKENLPYTLNLKCMTSPSCTTYSFPSRRMSPFSLAPASPPAAM